MHGYEMIQALTERFGGTYTPSAGTIYPRLGKLEEEGLVERVFDGRKSVYTITDAGRAELASRQSELDGIEEDMDDSVRRLADGVRQGVNDAMRTLKAELAAAARDARSEARATGNSSTGGDVRSSAASALRDADLILGEFRQQVRTELRTAVARGVVTQEVVDTLRRDLTAVRVTLIDRLHGK
jgi:DNA-binding PadR family transcriptional regulator